MSNSLSKIALVTALTAAVPAVPKVSAWKETESPVDREKAGEVWALQKSFQIGCRQHIEEGGSEDQLQGAARTRKRKLNEIPGCRDNSKWVCYEDAWVQGQADWTMVTAIKCEDRIGPDNWHLAGSTLDSANFIWTGANPYSY